MLTNRGAEWGTGLDAVEFLERVPAPSGGGAGGGGGSSSAQLGAMASKVVAGLPQRLDTLVKQAKARLPVTIVLVALLLVLLVTCVRSRRGGGGARYAAPVDAAPIDEHASFVSVSRRKGRGTSGQGSAGGGAATAAAAAPAQYGGQEVRAAMARLQQSDAATTARFSL